MFTERVWTITVCVWPQMAIVLTGPTVATAAAAVLQVFKADLVSAVTPLLQAALYVWRVSVEQYRAHSHCPRQLVCQGAFAIGLACEQLARLLAHHVSGLSWPPNINRLWCQLYVGKACLSVSETSPHMWHQDYSVMSAVVPLIKGLSHKTILKKDEHIHSSRLSEIKWQKLKTKIFTSEKI